MPSVNAWSPNQNSRCISLEQHALLSCARVIREDCLAAYYHYSCFDVSFNIAMCKLDVSELAYASRLLPLDLLQAVFTRKIPPDPLFDKMSAGHPDINPRLRLSIFVGGFGLEATLAGFVH